MRLIYQEEEVEEWADGGVGDLGVMLEWQGARVVSCRDESQGL